jgi:serine protease Do
VVRQIIDKGRVERGWLGISIEEVPSQKNGVQTPGGRVRVAETYPDQPAYKAGVRKDDIILKFNGESISSLHELQMLVAQTTIGATVPIEVLRNGKNIEYRIKVGKRPDNPAREFRQQQNNPPGMIPGR